jgi:hypothetical protein
MEVLSMRAKTALSLALLAACLGGCVGKAINQATIYKPVTGIIQMEVKLPTGESVSKVQFQVNDKVVGEDDGTASAPTYTAEVDTSTLPVDTLAKLAAVGVRADGSTVVLRENYILVETALDTGGTGAAASPDPVAVTPPASGATTTAYIKLGPTAQAAPVKGPAKATGKTNKAVKKTIIKL